VTTPGATTDALVHITDLFATIAEIGGVNPQALLDGSGRPLAIDGRSLLPHIADPASYSPRPYLFTEGFYPNGPGPYAWRRRAVRDAEWKLTRVEDDGLVTEELFRYEPGAYDEGPDRLIDGLDGEEAPIATRLREAMATITTDLGAP
jgi:arylsulfatase A-like enzyme